MWVAWKKCVKEAKVLENGVKITKVVSFPARKELSLDTFSGRTEVSSLPKRGTELVWTLTSPCRSNLGIFPASYWPSKAEKIIWFSRWLTEQWLSLLTMVEVLLLPFSSRIRGSNFVTEIGMKFMVGQNFSIEVKIWPFLKGLFSLGSRCRWLQKIL